MSDVTHTPGLWAVSIGCDQYLCAEGRWIGSTMGVRGEEGAANMRLASAAPELLAALVEILGPLNVCSDNLNVRDDACLPIDMTMGELRRARAAIAKATHTPAGN